MTQTRDNQKGDSLSPFPIGNVPGKFPVFEVSLSPPLVMEKWNWEAIILSFLSSIYLSPTDCVWMHEKFPTQSQ